MVSFLFILLASISDAIMDTLHHHWNKSIFFKELNNKNKKYVYWWNPILSWENKYIDRDISKGYRKLFNIRYKLFKKDRVFSINYPVQLTDAWHLFKTIMIFSICLSIITFDSNYYYYLDGIVNIPYKWISFLLLLLIYGLIWNCTFSLFYNRLLIRKSERRKK